MWDDKDTDQKDEADESMIALHEKKGRIVPRRVALNRNATMLMP